MNREYKAKDKVLVKETSKQGETIATFYAAPYSHAGLDNYKYKGKMYKGFQHMGDCKKEDFVYILLSEPLFK